MFLHLVSSNTWYLLSISTTIFFKAIEAFLGSVTTGVSKCGTPLYIDNSTFLGSTITNFTSSGLALIRIEAITQLIHTDLPLPVAPAIKRCGVALISAHLTVPMISFPSPTARIVLSLGAGNLDNISLNETAEFTLLGSSIPIVLFPGIGACILTSLAAKLRAISF